MKKAIWGAVALLAAVVAPLAAIGQQQAQVVFATPGSASGSGAINRFTLRFSEAMIALGDPRAPSPVKIKCAVPSEGRWIDQQTYVLDFQRPLPGGIKCSVTLRDGLKTARGSAVGGTSDFTIDTGGPLVRSILAGANDEAIEEDQVFLVATNAPATPQSVAAGAYCAIDGSGERIPVDVLGRAVAAKLLADLGDDDWESRRFLENSGLPRTVSSSEAERTAALANVTAVKCRRPMPPGRNIALVWGRTVASADGRLAGKDERFDFRVRKAFVARWSCSRVNPQSGCNPVQEARLMFSGEVPVAQALAARVTFPDGTVLTPRLRDDDRNSATVSQVQFDAPLPAAQRGRLSLPAGLRDDSGRLLSNGQRFPLDVQIAAAPPLVKFAAEFGIIEAKDEAVLPVTVRAVEPALAQKVKSISTETLRVDGSDFEVAKWLRDVSKHERAQSDEVPDGVDADGEPKTRTVERTGDTPLLGRTGEALKLGLPGAGKDFEVIGIPLKKPGFYVVELASPLLGAALLQPGKTRYVTSAALVTNMAVHFKWGRDTSLAWVTSLDTGAPVAGAEVRVISTCTGKEFGRGTTGADGRINLTSLPMPDDVPDADCGDDGPFPMMVSARANGDFSFTLTNWDEGIQSYDFDLPYVWRDQGDLIHTVFDRTLAKQGETVHMKHIMRRPTGGGFAYAKALAGQLKLTHQGSDTEFLLPLSIGTDGVGENSWAIPKGAPMGTYGLSIIKGEETIDLSAEINVEEYRLPTMRATITGPKAALVRPSQVPLSLFAGYLSGGPAANLPVSIRTAFDVTSSSPKGWSDWNFGGAPVIEGTVALSGNNEAPPPPLPLSQTIPLTLAGDGTARTTIDIARPIERETLMSVEMDYQDANGETLTASRRILLHPAALRLGIKTDGWMMRGDDLRVKLVALDHDGKVISGRPVKVEVYSQEILTARRRLIGGYYAYDNQLRTKRLGTSCAVTTDRLGFANCALQPGVSGEVTMVASTSDANGNVARAVTTVWLAGKDDWWFGGDNGDRMDVVPEAKSYKAGETARFQVRMPFREATALVTVEREGVLSSFVTQLSGKDPVVSVKLPGSYAPNVYVSVMAVRGRIGGFKQWTAEIARDWGLPFLSLDGYRPTAIVDLARPSFRMGVARVDVGWEGHQLDVDVKADRERYSVGETAQIDVAVHSPGGNAPASAEVAFAAVDEALLQLQANESWKLLDAMMGERALSVQTSTAQMHVVGKRHYGKKAVAAGGGGGADSANQARDNFKPVLLWKGRVALDGSGRARIPVKLADSLSSYRLVAIANAGPALFGTGSTTIRTAQDLSIFAGLPPTVRTGDSYSATFTLRNGTDKPMTVTANAIVTPAIPGLQPQTVTIAPGASAPVNWQVVAPDGVSQLKWDVTANAAGKQVDRIAQVQDVAPLVPVETWASTLLRVGPNTSIPVQAPAGALAGQGVVDVRLANSLTPTLQGVRDYMAAYPYRCFEQQTSRFVTLDDITSWNGLAAEIPAYLDDEGLLRYWPQGDTRGSIELTAYVLSITKEAGYAIPASPREKMLTAMKRVVEGKLTRSRDWEGNDRYLKVAALAALARHGQSRPALFGQIGLVPADMPTTVLADWLTVLELTRGAPLAMRPAAEAVLRQRIAYEGTRLDLTDKASAPWWMMSSGDEMAVKTVLVALGRPGWGADDGKMMVGAAMRQKRGHWDTTTANAWGAVAARKFGRLYPASAITGQTSIVLGGETKTQSWPFSGEIKPISFGLPAAQSQLGLKHEGPGPWAFVTVKAAVPLTAPLFAGYKIKKSLIAVQQAQKGVWSRGDVVKVRLEIEASAGRTWVVVNDPIPPGATILGGLGGQSQQLAGAADGPEGSWPSYVERGNDFWRGYYQWAPEGRFSVEYVVRLNGVGQFKLPPTRVEAMYSPEIRGQLPNAPMTIANK